MPFFLFLLLYFLCIKKKGATFLTKMFGWVWFRLRPGGMNQKDCGPRTVCPRIKSNSQLNKIIEGNNTQGTNKEYRLNSLEKNTTTTVQCKCPCTVRIRIPKLVKNKYKQLGFRSKWCDPCSIMYGFFFSCLNVFPLRFIDDTFQL